MPEASSQIIPATPKVVKEHRKKSTDILLHFPIIIGSSSLSYLNQDLVYSPTQSASFSETVRSWSTCLISLNFYSFIC